MFGKKQAATTVEDAWQIFETTHEGKRLVVRANVGAKPLAGHKDYAIKVGMAVPFSDPQQDGMPTPAESIELGAIEEQLAARLEGHGVLVLVLTTGGMREFVAYTGDGNWLPAFDKGLQSSVSSHRVQIDARTDPKWTAYRAFVR